MLENTRVTFVQFPSLCFTLLFLIEHTMLKLSCSRINAQVANEVNSRKSLFDPKESCPYAPGAIATKVTIICNDLSKSAVAFS